MTSPVYFVDLRATSPKDNKASKVGRLFKAAFGKVFRKDDLTAVKVHFGELGNDTFVSPLFVRSTVSELRAGGAKPFVTDTNTLYNGGRGNSVDHLNTAVANGFAGSVIQAPLIIADGLCSDNQAIVDIEGKHFRSVKIGGEIASADSMLVISHFKGHMLAGFGGAIKNLGMGCATAYGKAEQHSTLPVLFSERCTGCGRCADVCSRGALSVDRVAHLDKDLCVGCGECLRACPSFAIDFDWMVEIQPFIERMTEYALGAVKGKEGRVGYLNVLVNITPDCDCAPWSDAAFVPNIGILASIDPVAIDHASMDLVNAQRGLEGSALKGGLAPGEDKFSAIWKHTHGMQQIEYGAKIGLGNANYNLISV